MWDTAASFVGGDALKKRTEAISGSSNSKPGGSWRQDPSSASPSLEDIEALAMSLPAQQRTDMLKWLAERRDYLAFCKRNGIEA